MDYLRAFDPLHPAAAVLVVLCGCFNPEVSSTGDESSSGLPVSSTGPGPGSTTAEGSSSGGADSSSGDGSSGSPAVCGNGIVEGPSEECDDGNDDDTDECVAGCVAATCGDGLVWAGSEECDEAGETATCDDDCTAPACGDGNANAAAGEECDDGNMVDTDACITGCVAATCGDGFVQAGTELCDDGNADDTDACVTGCLPAQCGDGFVQAGVESCDDGNMIDDDTCTNLCEPPTRYIFVTSTMYTGNLGGLAGADAACQARAAVGGLPGTYLAWVSTAAESPATRMIQGSGPYLRPDGVQVAPSWAGLVDGSLDAPINVTEIGGPAPIGNTGCGGGGFPTVWSGTSSSGNYSGGSSCADWTSEEGGGQWGRASDIRGTWTSWCSGGLCSWLSPLYCVQQ